MSHTKMAMQKGAKPSGTSQSWDVAQRRRVCQHDGALGSTAVLAGKKNQDAKSRPGASEHPLLSQVESLFLRLLHS